MNRGIYINQMWHRYFQYPDNAEDTVPMPKIFEC